VALLLPGSIEFDAGTRADYRELARHHYLTKPPATWAALRVARHLHRGRSRVVACAVLSWPVPMLEARIVHFGLDRSFKACLDFANAHIRTVSRVVVHPQFRSLGLAGELVRQLIDLAPTRYVESSARMARFTRFLESAGMTRITPGDATTPAYFLIHKQESPCVPDPNFNASSSTSAFRPTNHSTR
jgi:GNAT superfamily N-acetyltransferase